jgi:hypothetical protein
MHMRMEWINEWICTIITFPNFVRPSWCSLTKVGATDTLSTGDACALQCQDYNFSQVIIGDEGKQHNKKERED